VKALSSSSSTAKKKTKKERKCGCTFSGVWSYSLDVLKESILVVPPPYAFPFFYMVFPRSFLSTIFLLIPNEISCSPFLLFNFPT
jgi:hypothetical protein